MGFSASGSTTDALHAAAATALLMLAIPKRRNTRSTTLTLIVFLFFIPSVVLHFLKGGTAQYITAIILGFAAVVALSSLKIRPPQAISVSYRDLLFLLSVTNLCVLALYVAFDGHRSINFDIWKVYEFRAESADRMPNLFGYIFSNSSKVLIPAATVLAIHLRNWFALVIALLCAILLFGVTHHKGVLFTTLFVGALYFLIRGGLTLWRAAFIPLGIMAFGAIEHLYNSFVLSSEAGGNMNSLFVRRFLLVPPLLDMLYVEFFSEFPKLYWSTSRLGLGLYSNPYDLAAPFLIAEYGFGNREMSANTGLIGSGFSHAGIVGVVLYATLAGLLISYLNAVGRVAGHGIVIAISFPVLLNIFTSTDFTTAFLSHGLIVLLGLMSLLPRVRGADPSK